MHAHGDPISFVLHDLVLPLLAGEWRPVLLYARAWLAARSRRNRA